MKLIKIIQANKRVIARFSCFYLLLPFLLELVIESLSRKSVIASFSYMIGSPLLFFFNVLIIMLTLSIAMFFKREVFVLILASIVWLAFGIINFVLLQFRVTPFSAVDFSLISSAIKVSSHYLNLFNIAMLILAAAMIVIGLIAIFRKAPVNQKYSHKRLIYSTMLFATVGVAIGVIHGASHSVQELATNYTNIAEAYENYGFAYCFANSVIDTGIDKPQEYDQEMIDGILDRIEDEPSATECPNIIFIQLESFFDVTYVNGLQLSEDATPIFRSLREKYSTGLLTVPTVGAGTVNTEFEILTGMSQQDFGAGQYPYKTILKSTTSESICQDLKKLGYRTHAVHNNEATFYGRNKVFSNLGFDTFTSMEYMNGLIPNPNGWWKDEVLVTEIEKALDETQAPDFVLGITVQGHGKYNVSTKDAPNRIQVSGAAQGKATEYQYYVNQLYEVDQVIGQILHLLNKRDEKSVLVLYGDHLPSLDLEEKNVKNGNLFQTQYVIWDNLGLEKTDQNLASYQLYPMVLDRLGIHEGVITKYHQQTDDELEQYREGLTALSYDLLYGENYAYDGENPFEATEIQMGVDNIEITDIVLTTNQIEIQGNGFTPFVKVRFRGKELETNWKDAHTLVLNRMPDYNFEEEDDNVFQIEVQDEDGIVLSTANEVKWSETSLSKLYEP